MGRLTGITAPNGDTLAYQFDAGGRLIQRSMPNGVSARFAYNEDNSLRQVVNRDTASHILTQHDYAYDGVGQRASLAEAFNDASLGQTASLAQAYTYDELKRLTAVSASGALSRNWTYGYDPLGNRTLMGVSSGNDSQSVTLQYDAANQLSKYTDGSGQVTPAPTYDANGNLTYDGLRTYTWDALDQLIQVSGGGSSAPISYSYDDSGRRIAKATAGTQTLWTYDGQDIYAEYTDKWTTPSAVYTSGGATDDPVIRVVTTGASSYGPALYYHADGLGTVVGLSNNQDSSTQLTVLDAWGVSLGGPPTPMAQYGYTGREPDEAGLVYMRARYYSPQFGRFVSRDPAGLQGGINAYAYCGNNPTNCTDPSGLMPQSALSSFVDSSYFGGGAQVAGLSPTVPEFVLPGFSQVVDVLSSVKIPPSVVTAIGIVTSPPAIVGTILSGFPANLGQPVQDQLFGSYADPKYSPIFNQATNNGDKNASTPTGQRGSPMDVPNGTNAPTNIGGRDFGGHALDQMQGRGVTPTPVQDTIQNGTQSPGNKPGRTVHTSQDGRLTVVTEGGKVITVITK